MVLDLFSSLFGGNIYIDYEEVVQASWAEEAVKKAGAEDRIMEKNRVALLPAAKPVANRTSILTTKEGVLLNSVEGRPLAEPPIFNHDWFVREAVPSDDKLNAMFPADPVQRTAYRDMVTERGLLAMFEDWADDMRNEGGENRDRNRETFYENLRRDIEHDTIPIDQEYYGAYNNRRRPTDLIRWEEEFLDNDPSSGHTASLKKRLKLGEDPFTIYIGGNEARAKYGYLLENGKIASLLPRHDLESWESYQLQKEGRRTTALEKKLWKYFNDGSLYLTSKDDARRRDDFSIPPFFTKAYYGGIEAKAKWGHLADLGSWESRNLDPDGGTRRIRMSLEGGWANLFTGTGGELARIKYEPMFAELLRDVKHDLATWKRFQLDDDGKGTTRIRHKIKESLMVVSYPAMVPYFSEDYYGGMQAREAFGYLLWEAVYIDRWWSKGGTSSTEKRLAGGEDLFEGWIGESALPKYRHLLQELPHGARHDLKTWEAYNLDRDGGTTNIRKWLEQGVEIFDPSFYGGVQARQKYGWTFWAHKHLSVKAFRSACRSGKLDPTDCKPLKKQLASGEDIFHSWYGASAKAKFGFLLGVLSRPPAHDLETWEWFHVTGGNTEKAVAELKAYKEIFDPSYFGGVEAREKWGFLAPEPVRDNWDGRLDLEWRASMRVSPDPAAVKEASTI